MVICCEMFILDYLTDCTWKKTIKKMIFEHKRKILLNLQVDNYVFLLFRVYR